MTNKELIIIADYSQETQFTLPELCELCGLSLESINEFIVYEIIQPTGNESQQWIFDLAQLQRIRRALRLQHDLELDLANVALVLELVEELEQLRARSALLEKHLLK